MCSAPCDAIDWTTCTKTVCEWTKDQSGAPTITNIRHEDIGECLPLKATFVVSNCTNTVVSTVNKYFEYWFEIKTYFLLNYSHQIVVKGLNHIGFVSLKFQFSQTHMFTFSNKIFEFQVDCCPLLHSARLESYECKANEIIVL